MVFLLVTAHAPQYLLDGYAAGVSIEKPPCLVVSNPVTIQAKNATLSTVFYNAATK